MSVVLESSPSGSNCRPLADWIELQRRTLLCLGAAGLWAAPHFWGNGATHATGSIVACLVLAAGAAISLLAVTICYGLGGADSQLPERISPLSLSLGLVALPLAVVAHQVLVHTHHRPLAAVLLAVGSLVMTTLSLLVVGAAVRRFDSKCVPGSSRLLPRRRLVFAGIFAGALAAIFVPRLVVGPGQSPSEGVLEWLWIVLPYPRDIVLGGFLAGLVSELPVTALPLTLAKFAPFAHLILVGAALWLVAADPSLLETLRSAPVISGVLGLFLP